MTSLEIREFEHTLRNYVDEIALPWEVKKSILVTLAADAETRADEEIAKELKEREKQNEQGI